MIWSNFYLPGKSFTNQVVAVGGVCGVIENYLLLQGLWTLGTSATGDQAFRAVQIDQNDGIPNHLVYLMEAYRKMVNRPSLEVAQVALFSLSAPCAGLNPWNSR